MNLRIGILGTRGIPNHYGGFEQVAGYLSKGLVAKGHDVTVYSSHNHPYQQTNWNGVKIVHCYDPEYLIGTIGQFVYDFKCIMDARKRNFDVLLLLGYTSSSVWGFLYPPDSVIISNMDGLEWKRSKYSKSVRKFLKYAERLAVKFSDFHIADSIVIKQYLDQKYNIDCRYIPYGADIFLKGGSVFENDFGLNKQEYFLLMARMEPENNVELILDGFRSSRTDKKFVVIGDTQNKFGNYLVKKFKSDHRIHFAGSIFNKEKVQNLTCHSSIYFHGHSVGGTNPSLLEAMADAAFIAAHDNPFNKAVLNGDASYFSNSDDVRSLIDSLEESGVKPHRVNSNLNKIKNQFNWQMVVNEYEQFMMSCYLKLNNEETIFNTRLANQ
jgi:glycosyltransferase involved in cell wall biosynthesis